VDIRELDDSDDLGALFDLSSRAFAKLGVCKRPRVARRGL
jgi:hypothetical protein